MQFQPPPGSTVTRQPNALPSCGIYRLPFDIFTEIVKFLAIKEALSISAVSPDPSYRPHLLYSSILLFQTCKLFREWSATPLDWIAQARIVLQRRPLPILPPQVSGPLTVAQTRKATLSALTVEQNLLSPSPTVRGFTKLSCGQGKRPDLLAILPGGKHLITSLNEDSLACWDLTTQKRLAAWPFGLDDRVLQWRPVDGGSNVMFIVYTHMLNS